MKRAYLVCMTGMHRTGCIVMRCKASLANGGEKEGFCVQGRSVVGRRFRPRRPCPLINNTISPFLRAFRSFSLPLLSRSMCAQLAIREGYSAAIASLINITWWAIAGQNLGSRDDEEEEEPMFRAHRGDIVLEARRKADENFAMWILRRIAHLFDRIACVPRRLDAEGNAKRRMKRRGKAVACDFAGRESKRARKAKASIVETLCERRRIGCYARTISSTRTVRRRSARSLLALIASFLFLLLLLASQRRALARFSFSPLRPSRLPSCRSSFRGAKHRARRTLRSISFGDLWLQESKALSMLRFVSESRFSWH